MNKFREMYRWCMWGAAGFGGVRAPRPTRGFDVRV